MHPAPQPSADSLEASQLLSHAIGSFFFHFLWCLRKNVMVLCLLWLELDGLLHLGADRPAEAECRVRVPHAGCSGTPRAAWTRERGETETGSRSHGAHGCAPARTSGGNCYTVDIFNDH